MKDFTFQVSLVAMVRVRAADERIAREVVPTVLGAPGTAEVRLANRTNLDMGRDATVTSVEFSIGPIKTGWSDAPSDPQARLCENEEPAKPSRAARAGSLARR